MNRNHQWYAEESAALGFNGIVEYLVGNIRYSTTRSVNSDSNDQRRQSSHSCNVDDKRDPSPSVRRMVSL